MPLRDTGYGIGVVARSTAEGLAFGYFFGPRVTPETVDPRLLRADGAWLVCRFGDLGLVEGVWPVVGSIPDWRDEDWPLPPMARMDVVDGRGWLTRYDDELRAVAEQEIPAPLARQHVKDALKGVGAVEIVLTRIIQEFELRRLGGPWS